MGRVSKDARPHTCEVDKGSMTSVTPGREELACIIDPDAFENAMLQDDLTPSERLHFSQSRERDKIVALNKADTILARLAAKPADEWQDISTAPKNGSAFLASSEGWMTVCHWHRHQQCWSAVGPSYSRYAFNEQPTRWQPLPTAPATTGAPKP